MAPIMKCIASAFITLLALSASALTPHISHNVPNHHRSVACAAFQGVTFLAVAVLVTPKHNRSLNQRSVPNPSGNLTAVFSTSLATASVNIVPSSVLPTTFSSPSLFPSYSSSDPTLTPEPTQQTLSAYPTYTPPPSPSTTSQAPPSHTFSSSSGSSSNAPNYLSNLWWKTCHGDDRKLVHGSRPGFLASALADESLGRTRLWSG